MKRQLLGFAFAIMMLSVGAAACGEESTREATTASPQDRSVIGATAESETVPALLERIEAQERRIESLEQELARREGEVAAEAPEDSEDSSAHSSGRRRPTPTVLDPWGPTGAQKVPPAMATAAAPRPAPEGVGRRVLNPWE